MVFCIISATMGLPHCWVLEISEDDEDYVDDIGFLNTFRNCPYKEEIAVL
jgi:hypothetical protein